ncbi:Mss4-like protein [Annulohypoxylon moriforme]|nr:Mss4-like protein [Annulohypoxylon moriforme]
MGGQQPLKKHRANCHCGAYIYEVNLPGDIKNGLKCNCSYCYKFDGIYQHLQDNNDIRFVKGDPTTLSSYEIGGVKHQFCLNCGTYLLRVDSKIYVNIRAFQNINVWDLSTKLIDGLGSSTWSPPGFTGSEPPADIENAKVYTGGCHCGAITLALKSKPINSTYKANLLECDCSICTRNAYLWIYPSKSQVTITGTSNFGYYSFGRGIWKKTFCRTCGVPIHNHIDDYTPDQISKLPEEHREWAVDHLDWSPINLRVLDGINLGELPLRRIEGSKFGKVPYVNP